MPTEEPTISIIVLFKSYKINWMYKILLKVYILVLYIFFLSNCYLCKFLKTVIEFYFNRNYLIG